MSTPTPTPSLTRFWLALERLPGPAAVAAEWRARAGADFDRAAAVLVPDAELAAAVPHPDGAGEPLAVVAHGPDEFAGVGTDGTRVPLPRADLVVYRADLGALARGTAAALGLDPDGAPVDGLSNTRRAGTWHLPPAPAVPAFFTVQLDAREYAAVVAALAARTAGPFLLCAPTTRHHRAGAQDRLDASGGAFVPLADAVRLTDAGSWEATDRGWALMDEFRSRVAPDPGGAVRFPTPPGARWSDVRIGFHDGHRVTVRIGAVHRTLNYTQMGFADGRSAEPDVQWELLRAFADRHGTLTWDGPAADRKNQKRKELLARALHAFFRIDGEPIVPTDCGTGWRTAFAVATK